MCDNLLTSSRDYCITIEAYSNIDTITAIAIARVIYSDDGELTGNSAQRVVIDIVGQQQ